ncbi:MAG: TIGR02996 domain-containing protein [Planctomycetes bacterium]|nr:TIGR02996 domain-containing protein [Planctomycetota bacterium]
MSLDNDSVPDLTLSRRGFLCVLGSATLGTFVIPTLPGGTPASAEPPVRKLLTTPIRKISKKGVVQISWTEQTEQGVRTVTWMPSSPEELKEATLFYDRAHQVVPESPLERVTDWVKDLFAGTSRTPEEQQLLQAIIAAPGDEQPLLNYADWLTSQGNPHGEFIRLDCLLESLPPEDPQSAELNRRWSELYEQLEAKLMQPVERLGAGPELANGLVRVVEIESSKILPRKAKQLFDAAPLLRELFLVGNIDLKGVAQCPQMAQIESLQLSQCEATDEGLAAIFASPFFKSLTDLSLQGLPLSDELVEQLAQSPMARQLKRVNLDGCELTTAAIAALVKSPGWQQLEELGLGGNKLDDAALKLLAGCANLGHVRRLTLNELRPTAEGITALVQASFFPTLEVLDLSRSRLEDHDKIAPLGQVPQARLRELDLSASVDGNAFLTLLTQRPWLSHLQRLDLSLCEPLTADGIRQLVESPYLGDLTAIDFGYSKPGLNGVQLLVNCPRFAKLQRLELNDCALSADAVRLLLDADFADSLEKLNLRYNPIGDEGAMLLVRSQRLRKLRSLYLIGDDFQETTRQALEQRFGDALLM